MRIKFKKNSVQLTLTHEEAASLEADLTANRPKNKGPLDSLWFHMPSGMQRYLVGQNYEVSLPGYRPVIAEQETWEVNKHYKKTGVHQPTLKVLGTDNNGNAAVQWASSNRSIAIMPAEQRKLYTEILGDHGDH